MKASEALEQLYKVATDEQRSVLDDLTWEAGLRVPLDDTGPATTGGEMRPVDENSVETLEELQDNFVPFAERT